MVTGTSHSAFVPKTRPDSCEVSNIRRFCNSRSSWSQRAYVVENEAPRIARASQFSATRRRAASAASGGKFSSRPSKPIWSRLQLSPLPSYSLPRPGDKNDLKRLIAALGPQANRNGGLSTVKPRTRKSDSRAGAMYQLAKKHASAELHSCHNSAKERADTLPRRLAMAQPIPYEVRSNFRFTLYI